MWSFFKSIRNKIILASVSIILFLMISYFLSQISSRIAASIALQLKLRQNAFIVSTDLSPKNSLLASIVNSVRDVHAINMQIDVIPLKTCLKSKCNASLLLTHSCENLSLYSNYAPLSPIAISMTDRIDVLGNGRIIRFRYKNDQYCVSAPIDSLHSSIVERLLISILENGIIAPRNNGK